MGAAAREQNALNGRSDAMNMSLSNELNSKKNEVDQLTNSLSEVKLSLETADKVQFDGGSTFFVIVPATETHFACVCGIC